MTRRLVRLSQLVRDVEDRGDDPAFIFIDPEDTVEIEEADDEDLDEE